MDERFWSKVEKSEGCWNWQAGRFRRTNGQLSYGAFGFDGRTQQAHRVAWMLTNGPIPSGGLVLHHCDNSACVRPSHLYIGDHADNTRDAVERRRMSSGSSASWSKLKPEDLPLIRKLHADGMATESIGPLFGVSGRAIRYVLSGQHWKYE